MSRLYEKLQQEKETILTTANRHHATNVRLFGSVVRGEEHDASDIDFLVDFLPGSTLFDQMELIDELSRILGRKVDVVSSRALNQHLRQRVLDEARPL